jgi:Family of unknown function (DUF6152)
VKNRLSRSGRLISSLAVVALVAGSAPAMAHHSFAAEFDANKPVMLAGTVTKIEWANPHAFFYIDVKDDAGKLTSWGLELGSPNGLMRQGWSRKSLKVGDQVRVEGSQAKDGSRLANARAVVLADGQKLFAASSQGNQPGEVK